MIRVTDRIPLIKGPEIDSDKLLGEEFNQSLAVAPGLTGPRQCRFRTKRADYFGDGDPGQNDRADRLADFFGNVRIAAKQNDQANGNTGLRIERKRHVLPNTR